jgi:hypothetical protein
MYQREVYYKNNIVEQKYKSNVKNYDRKWTK